jgi:hypothetical protein
MSDGGFGTHTMIGPSIAVFWTGCYFHLEQNLLVTSSCLPSKVDNALEDLLHLVGKNVTRFLNSLSFPLLKNNPYDLECGCSGVFSTNNFFPLMFVSRWEEEDHSEKKHEYEMRCKNTKLA